jgi:hypothetical protein
MVRYYPDDQEWIECAGFWLGQEKANPPQPVDLQHEEIVVAYDLSLEGFGEGTAILPSAQTLPSYMAMGKEGEWQNVVGDDHKRLSEMGARVFEHYQIEVGSIQQGRKLSKGEQGDIALAALATNYRVGPWEATALQVLTQSNIARILYALIDCPTTETSEAEETKKKEGSESGAAGDARPVSR